VPFKWYCSQVKTDFKVLVNHHSDYEFDPKKVHITDFGIAHITSLPNDSGGNNIVPGCLQYLAPEFRHFRTVNATTMSDMWAVGCIGYEMCVGLELTVSAECFQEIEARINGKPLDLRHIPERFGQNVHYVIKVCMEWDPEKRITSAKLADDLRAIIHLMKQGMKDSVEHNTFMNQKWR
jgi:serine/threonine protein kinase